VIRLIDRVCGALMLVGAGLHVAGSFATYPNAPDALLWSLCAGAYEALLGGVNLIRASRRRDVALAWLSLLGGIVWLGVVVSFARLVGNPFDPRVFVQGGVVLIPTAVSLRMLLRPYRPKHALPQPVQGTRPRRRTTRHGA
jgi:hypothetical protein